MNVTFIFKAKNGNMMKNSYQMIETKKQEKHRL